MWKHMALWFTMLSSLLGAILGFLGAWFFGQLTGWAGDSVAAFLNIPPQLRGAARDERP